MHGSQQAEDSHSVLVAYSGPFQGKISSLRLLSRAEIRRLPDSCWCWDNQAVALRTNKLRDCLSQSSFYRGCPEQKQVYSDPPEDTVVLPYSLGISLPLGLALLVVSCHPAKNITKNSWVYFRNGYLYFSSKILSRFKRTHLDYGNFSADADKQTGL